MNDKLKRVAIYIRVSSDKQAKTGDSLREQEDTLKEYVEKSNELLLYSTYIDDGISGQKLKRDEFSRLMEDVKLGNIDLIIFTKLDRWFRSLRHYLNTQAILEQYKVHWTAVSQAFFDTTTAHGRAFVAQSMTWAELEAQTGSERIRAVFDNKVKMGEAISGNAPYGYVVKDKKFVPNDKASDVINIFNHYNKTNNLTDTLRYMANDLDMVRTPSGLRNLLKNKKYIGHFRDNQNYCEPIIDIELFNDVQQALSTNIKSNTIHDYIFSGLLRCENCDHKLNSTFKTYYSGVKKDGTRTRYPKKACYRCRYANQIPKCKNTKEFKESVVEKYLLENISSIVTDLIKGIQAEEAARINYGDRIKKIETKIDRLKLAYLNEIISLDEYKNDRVELVNQIADLQTPVKTNKKDLTELNKFIDKDFFNNYDSLTVVEKRRLWRSIIKEITVNYDKEYKITFL